VTLRVRWLGRVPYREAHALQRALFTHSRDDHLLLLEHPPVYTLGRSADPAHVLVPPDAVGAELVATDRGGDVTYHGPGQLVGYPILAVPGKRGGGMADTVAYVGSVEQLLIDSLTDLGIDGAGRMPGHPGVWLDPEGPRPRKVAAIGVRLIRGRSMHGFALNVDPDLAMFGHIVPCGIADKGVTSLAAEGLAVSMREVVDAVTSRATTRWAPNGDWERQDVVWREPTRDVTVLSGEEPDDGPVARGTLRLAGRLAEAGVVSGQRADDRKPAWLRAELKTGPEFFGLRRTLHERSLATVCEEAGCPNIYECWADGTATFMINGDRCTRACGFCLVDTRHPEPVDLDEPERVAEAVEQMGLEFTVVTAVARDDLPDGGATGFAAVVEAIRRRTPDTGVELLIPDCKGDAAALDVVFSSRPDVLNHNIETVPRLQRAVRPNAGYARSLAVLGRAKAAELVTKSGLIVGMGEEVSEVEATLADLAGVGVDIVTIGQYLRPTSRHIPVARWWRPEEFEELREVGHALGIGHVEASPLTRSSYHARAAAGQAGDGAAAGQAASVVAAG
jgi:lipoic acid synthetase